MSCTTLHCITGKVFAQIQSNLGAVFHEKTPKIGSK